MIWHRKEKAEDHFVTFSHQEQRIAQLEGEIAVLSRHLLAYIEADLACGWKSAAEGLSATLRAIIENRQG
jgi:hypothetical protein